MATTKKNSSNAETKAPAEKKRTVLTQEERIAKAEQELEQLKLKAQGRDRKRHAVLGETIAALDVRIKDLQDKRDTARAEQVGIEVRIPELTPTSEAQDQLHGGSAEGVAADSES